jgi:hypothetical protein
MGSNEVDAKRSSPYFRYADQPPNTAFERLVHATYIGVGTVVNEAAECLR